MGPPSSMMTILVTLISMAMVGTSAMHVTQTYRDINGRELQNMDIDQTSGDIIVGATNTLAKLSQDLSLQQTASIKGQNSNLFVYSKGVVINKLLNTVILCSTSGGACESRSLGNISTILYNPLKPIVPKEKSTNNIVLKTSNPQQLHFANDFKKDGTSNVDLIPMLSSRVVDSLKLTHEDSIGSSAKYFQSQNLADGYFVQYIYAFSHGNYIYYISRQPNVFNQAIVSSKISRICLGDMYYWSYVEIQLDCLANSATQYSKARAAHFDPDTREVFLGFTNENSDPTSALCVFRIEDINTKMDETVRDCYKGNGRFGPAHFHKTSSCIDTSSPAEMCGQSDVAEAYPSIEGQTPIFQRPVITLPYTVVTALTTRLEGQIMVVYLCTSDGLLKKVTMSDSGVVAVVSEMNLGQGQSVLSPLFLDKDGHFLYAMTQSKVMKVNVDHCGERTTCQECTSSLDTVCGWCVMQNRCSKLESCPSAAISPTWLPAKNGVCAEMKDVFPNILSYDSLKAGANRQISFKLDKISVVDPVNIELQCSFVFMATKHVTIATIDMQGDRITCPLPPRARLPTLPQGVVKPSDGDHRKLEVEFQILGKTVVKRDVSLYDCGINLSCSKCVASTFGCKWCHVRGMCLDATKQDCPANQTLPAVKSVSLCPRLETSSQDADIVVHSGQTRQIVVRVANLQPDQFNNIHCLFTYLGEVKVSPGKVTNSNLLCDALTFSFSDKSLPIETADFTVTSGIYSQPLDNPQNIKVRIYKCGPMVTNCGQCLSMDKEYECGWCTAGIPQCSLQTACPASDWLDRASTCPDPQILRFNPLAGPIEGVTNISVHGLNLGKSYKDIEVTVAGVPCVVQSQHYESSQRFDCQTTGPSKVTDGVITVKINNQYTTESDSHFMFVEPSVTSLTPKQGPVSGGTTLAINGEYMNAGTGTTVDVGGSTCTVIKSNMSMLECMTSQQVANENQVYVEVNFGNLRKLVPEKFTYEKNPDISIIEPKSAFLSGGTTITAIGYQMQFIQRPQFFVEVGGSQKTTDCVLQNLTYWLICKTPRLNFPGENITETSPKEVQYGFNLDGVTIYRNISMDPVFGPLLYYPDPMVERFHPGPKKYEKEHKMVIKGNFRHVSFIIEDVSVTVGGSECTKRAATDDALSCEAPEKPREVDGNGNALVLLQVGNMKTEVGYLSYFESNKEEKPIAVGIIMGVVLPIIAIILLLAICVIRRHRKHKPSDNYIPDVWKDTEGKKEEEEIGMNHVSVKADMNGSIPDDKDTEPYIEELLSKIEDDAIRHNVKHFLIARRRLDIGDLLGKGNFGVTCKATYTRTEEDNPLDVAVKTVQGTRTDSDSVGSFLQTVTMYRDLQHPGIAPIVGVCITVSDDPMLVLPYARNGDLKSYVRDSNRSLVVIELLDFGHQVAEAMAYLESVHVVHGNLALRNCLVTDDKKIQVSDYGLNKELFIKDQYFKEDGKTKSLVKWAAPETMETVEFTSQSDVWSFGVVLWELLTRGVTPYPDVESADLQDYLEKGNRMKKPRQCPENIYELMLRCWAQESEVRPTFRQVADEIQAFTATESEEQNAGDETPLQNVIDVDSASELI